MVFRLGDDFLLQSHRSRTTHRGAARAAPLLILSSAPSGSCRCLFYISRQDTIRLQTESAGVPHSDPKTPGLAWIKPVTLPAHPALLDPPELPVPWAPIWTARWYCRPGPTAVDL